MRGGCRCHQFYGRREWHYVGVCIGLAGAIGIIKCGDGEYLRRVRGEKVGKMVDEHKQN